MNDEDINAKESKNFLKSIKNKMDQSFDYAKLKSDDLKDIIDEKIQKQALKNLKHEMALRQKTFDNYSDEEIEVLLKEEKNKIIHSLKNKSFIVVLSLLGLNIAI